MKNQTRNPMHKKKEARRSHRETTQKLMKASKKMNNIYLFLILNQERFVTLTCQRAVQPNSSRPTTWNVRKTGNTPNTTPLTPRSTTTPLERVTDL